MKSLGSFNSPKSNKLRKAPSDVDFDCVMCGNPECCLAHFPDFDAGVGQKTHDICGAHLCMACHTYADGAEGRHDYEFRFRAMHRTLKRLWKHGIIDT